MRASGTAVALAASIALIGCKGMKIVTDDQGTRVDSGSAASAAVDAAQGGSEDRHWIRSDEVFMAMYDGQSGMSCFEVTPGRVVEAASEATKGQAKLWELRRGQERWSADVYRSRPAEKGDLRNGVRVIFFKGPMDGGRSHGAPRTREDARPGGDAWFCSTIADDSEAFKGEYKVAGYDYACKVEALRVVEP
jgi:hypothetical protein